MKVSKHVEQLLRQGRKPRELIELGFRKLVVTRVRRQLREEKAALQKKEPKGTVQAETQLETPPESPKTIATIWQKVQSMTNDLKRIDSLIQELSEVAVLMIAARDFGIYRYETCAYQKDSVCTVHTWPSEDDIPRGIGEPVSAEKLEWRIKPSPYYCAMCTIPLENHIDDIEDKVSDDPLSGARYQIICNGCGSKGWIAVAIKCTNCGCIAYWGWSPKKE